MIKRWYTQEDIVWFTIAIAFVMLVVGVDLVQVFAFLMGSAWAFISFALAGQLEKNQKAKPKRSQAEHPPIEEGDPPDPHAVNP